MSILLSYNTTHRLFKVLRERLYAFVSRDDILKGEKVPVGMVR